MILKLMTLAVHFPIYCETPGDGGGGGGTGGGGETGSASTSATSATTITPTVYDVDHDTQIRVKGQTNPVKFGDHVRGLQSQFTKASQENARLKKEFEAYKQSQTQQQQQQRPPQGASPDPYEQLAALPYLTGKDAVEVVRSIADQMKQRDMVTLGALRQLKAMQESLGTLNGVHSSQAFEGKISRWLSEGGYPPEAANLAKEVYLAYEGDDLDQEFPQIFAGRWAELEKIMEARRMGKINAARKHPFVPGKGGNATPSKPLEIKPSASSRQVADELFGLLDFADNT